MFCGEKLPGMKKDQTIGFRGEFPNVGLAGFHQKEAAWFYRVLFKIDFVRSVALGKKHTGIEVVFVRLFDVEVSAGDMAFECIGVKHVPGKVASKRPYAEYFHGITSCNVLKVQIFERKNNKCSQRSVVILP